MPAQPGTDQPEAMVEWLSAKNAQLRAALMQIKELVVGDRIPNWQDNYRTTNTRSQIADLCDLALKD